MPRAFPKTHGFSLNSVSIDVGQSLKPMACFLLILMLLSNSFCFLAVAGRTTGVLARPELWLARNFGRPRVELTAGGILEPRGAGAAAAPLRPVPGVAAPLRRLRGGACGALQAMLGGGERPSACQPYPRHVRAMFPLEAQVANVRMDTNS